jgi:uncharacterized protein
LLDNETSSHYIITPKKRAVLVIRLSEIDDTFITRGSMEASRFTEVEDKSTRVITPVTYELTIRKFDNLVTVQGPVGCTMSITCSRCLDDFTLDLRAFLDIKLTPRTKITRASEAELRLDDMDVYYYEGDEIDLDPFIYEEVLLNVPIRPVCAEDCKGLCPVCGRNKNVEDCQCDTATHTLLGEKLKSFLN